MSNATICTFDNSGFVQPIYKAIWKAGESLCQLTELGNAGLSQQGFRDRAVEITLGLRNAAQGARNRLSDAQDYCQKMAKEGTQVADPRSKHLDLVITKADECADDILRDLDTEIAESYAESDFFGFEELGRSMLGLDPAQLVYRALSA